MSTVLKQFGRYFLLDHAAQGGMAEIYRARLASPEAPNRIIVIKKIQANYDKNSDFLQMFRSEIQISMSFNHPNIVQIHDFGEENQEPYIVMEWIDGKNIRQVLQRCQDLRMSLPVEFIVLIAEQSSQGLHYAHSFKNPLTGDLLKFVHRDISPQNILISYDGVVKLIDFGIAKTTINLEATRAGIIKGKPSYLSPEQISMEVLDGRSDLFSLGAVLWELLTGKKLFSGDNDLAVLKQIENVEQVVFPPSKANSNVPPELDQIVLKLLQRKKEDRYKGADQLQAALRKLLLKRYSDLSIYDLSHFLKKIFSSEIEEDRKKIQIINQEAESILGGKSVAAAPTEGTQVITSEPIEKKDTASEPSLLNMAVDPDSFLNFELNVDTSQPSATKNAQTKPTEDLKKKVLESDLKISARKNIFVPAAYQYPNKEKHVISSKKNTSRIKAQQNNYFKILLTSLTIFSFLATMYVLLKQKDQRQKWLAKADAVKSKAENAVFDTIEKPFKKKDPNEIKNKPKKQFPLRVLLEPPGGVPTITINGTLLNHYQPVARIPLDTLLEISVKRKGYYPYNAQIEISSSQVEGLVEWPYEVSLKPLKGGYLTVHSSPSAIASLIVDGAAFVLQTPFEKKMLPVGNYEMNLTNSILGMEKKVEFSIEEGKTVFIDTKLNEKN